MGFILFPDVWYESSFAVDYEALWKDGIRAVFFDIDNTLVGHGEPMDDRAKKLLMSLQDRGFRLMAISNNREERVRSFCEPVSIPYIYKAGKPGPAGLLKAISATGFSPKETAFVGDQLFTDMAGARYLGIRAVLVKPLYKKEEPQIVLKRRLEAPILFLFKFLHRNKCRF